MSFIERSLLFSCFLKVSKFEKTRYERTANTKNKKVSIKRFPVSDSSETDEEVS